MAWHVSPEIIEEVLLLLEQGKSISQACKELNLSSHYRAIQSYLNKNNLHSRYSYLVTSKNKQNNFEHIVKLYTQEGYTLKALGEKYNVAPNTISSWLKEKDVLLRTMAESRKKLKLNSHYFDEIITCPKAYVLGFLAADGYVTDKNGIGFGIKASDIEILLFIKDQWECENQIRIKDTKPNKAAVLQVESKYMAEKLKSLTIIPRKTYQLDPKAIFARAGIKKDSDLEKAFLLGYFDGDGGISHFIPSEKQRKEKHYSDLFNLTVTGTRETCEYYYNFTQKIGFLFQRHPDRPVNNWTYGIGGRNQCKKLLSPLYEVKDKIGFCLSRKYEIYKKL